MQARNRCFKHNNSGHVHRIIKLKNQLDNEILKKILHSTKISGIAAAKQTIKNTDLTVGALISNKICELYGEAGLTPGSIKLEFEGTAGQSFGAFLAKGVQLKLYGEANDYVGKGLSGGRIIVRLPRGSKLVSYENVIIGNTCLYGATSGEAFINGVAGERFGVRNSGATAIVEGVGDHGCEYMTGGNVVILGKIGRNFAAGMSGGVSYLWNCTGDLLKNINQDLVSVEKLEEYDARKVFGLIEKHFYYTYSSRAKFILDNWKIEMQNFIKIISFEYKEAITKMNTEYNSPGIEEISVEGN